MDLYEIQELIDQTNVLRDLNNGKPEKRVSREKTRQASGIQPAIRKPYEMILAEALSTTITKNEKLIAAFADERAATAQSHFSAVENEIPLYANSKDDLKWFVSEDPSDMNAPQYWAARQIGCKRALAKLSTLFADEDVGRGVLSTLLKSGAILAGDAVVYALCKHVRRRSVGDIDAFVPTAEAFLSLIRTLRPFCVKPMITTVNPYLYEASVKQHECGNTKYQCSTVQVDIGQGVPIQLVFKENAGVMDVLNLFDLDYVCCAIDREKITMTQDCVAAHHTKTVILPRADKFRPANENGSPRNSSTKLCFRAS